LAQAESAEEDSPAASAPTDESASSQEDARTDDDDTAEADEVSDPSTQLQLPAAVPGRRLVVLQVAASSTVFPALRRRVESAVLDGFRSRDIHVLEADTVASTLAPLGSPLALSCRAGHCVSWILDALSADAGLVLHVTAAASSYTLEMTILGPYGEELAQSEESCAICTIEEFLERVGRVAAEESVRVPRRVPSGRVGIYATPSDALIHVDGLSLGPGPLHLPLAEGTHLIEASHDGHSSVRQTVQVQPGRLSLVDLELTRGGDALKPRGHARNVRPFLWVTVATTLGAAVVGAVLLGTHTNCDAADEHRPCATLAWTGLGLLTGGVAAALTAGIGLFLLEFGPSGDDANQ
jgi:hypothetical protein